MPRHVLQAVPLRIANQVGALTETTNVPTCVRKYDYSSHSSGVSSTTRSFTPAVAHFLVEFASPRVLHNVFDQLWIDHQPESIDCPFQHPTQKFHQWLAGVPGIAHLSRAWCVPCLLSISHTLAGGPQSRNRRCDAWSTCAHAHYCVHRGLVRFGSVHSPLP